MAQAGKGVLVPLTLEVDGEGRKPFLAQEAHTLNHVHTIVGDAVQQHNGAAAGLARQEPTCQ